MSVRFEIFGETAAQFVTEWMRVLPLLTSGGQLKDVVTNDEDQIVADAPQALNGEVIPPAKRTRTTTIKKPAPVIEGTATEAKPGDEQKAVEQTPAVEQAKAADDAKKFGAEDVRAAFNALMKESPQREEAVYSILKEFKMKNATEVAAQDQAVIVKLLDRCKEKAAEDKAAAVTA